MKKFLLRILLMLVSILIGYVIADGAYRVYHYFRLRSAGASGYPFSYVEKPMYVFDRQIGYRYSPNINLSVMQFDAKDKLLRSNSVRTNNVGHVSPTDDSVDKPNTEFRVAILGDS